MCHIVTVVKVYSGGTFEKETFVIPDEEKWTEAVPALMTWRNVGLFWVHVRNPDKSWESVWRFTKGIRTGMAGDPYSSYYTAEIDALRALLEGA